MIEVVFGINLPLASTPFDSLRQAQDTPLSQLETRDCALLCPEPVEGSGAEGPLIKGVLIMAQLSKAQQKANRDLLHHPVQHR